MQIVVANNIGFCFGVKRAVDMAYSAEEKCKKRIYTLGEIIHNSQVVKKLSDDGIFPVDSVSELKPGDTLIIRSHGAEPKVFRECEELGIHIVDATCPFVKRIHTIVEAASKDGSTVIIVGKSDHPEIIGIKGHCVGACHVVSSTDELSLLPDYEKVCIVSQTTFMREAYDTIAEGLRTKYSDAVVHDTICDTTRNRQDEARELSIKCDRMIVIGGRNSSNTQKLLSICKKNCKKTESIENTRELALEKLEKHDIIGIVAGASTPDWMIREVITRMNELEQTVGKINDDIEAAVEKTAAVEPVSEPKAETTSTTTANEEPAKETLPVSAEDFGDDQSFEDVLDSTMRRIHNGQIVTGVVVQIANDEVCVNIGYKSDGIISRSEFSSDPDVNPAEVVKVGDKIKVEVLKVNDGEGNVRLSRKNIESREKLEAILQDDSIKERILIAIPREIVKGGLVADVEGLKAFIPASLLSTRYVENLSVYLNKPLEVRIIEVDKQRKRMVASAKAVMIEREAEARVKALESLEIGSKVKGTVKRVVKFGAFVDIGCGIEGLLHVSDMGWGRVKQPSDVVSVNQELEVLILDVKTEEGKVRVSLGYKQLLPKPWTTAAEKYPVGSIITGKVIRLAAFGAFVEVEPTVEGLVHISQVSVRHIAKVEDEIHVGDEIRCKVLDVDTEAKRMSLSRKEVILEENPEIAAELEREREEREKERAAQRERAAAEQQQRKEKEAKEKEAAEQKEPRSRREHSSNNDSDRREHRERRAPREDSDFQLPPVETATTSLASLFSGFKAEDSDDDK